MGLIALPRRWMAAPPPGTPLDPTNPLTAGLLVALPPRHDGASVAGVPASVVGTRPVPIVTAQGEARDFSGGSFSALDFPDLTAPHATVTFLVSLVPTSTLSQAWIGWGGSGYGGILFGTAGQSAATTPCIFMGNQGTYNWGTGVFAVGAPVMLVATVAGTYGAAILYKNGVEYGSVNVGNITNTTTPLRIGGANSNGTTQYPTRGPIAFAAAWNRVLSAGEVAELYRDPYQLYAPPSRWRSRAFAITAPTSTSDAATGTLTEAGESLGGTATAADATTGTASEAGEAIAGSSSSSATATGSATEAGESASATATTSDATSGTIGEAGEALGGTATVSESASGAATQAGESLTGNTGAAPDQASGTITQGGESLSGTSSSSTSASGTAGATESLSGTASASDTATGAATQTGEHASGSATVSEAATATLSEAGESLSATATSTMPGQPARVRIATIVRSRYAVTTIIRSRYRVSTLIS